MQIPFEDIYNDVFGTIEEQKSEPLSLLKEYITTVKFIPHNFRTTFYQKMGKGHLYLMDILLCFVIMKKLFALSKTRK